MKYYLRTVGTLIIITVCVVLMLSVINLFTSDLIEEDEPDSVASASVEVTENDD